MIAQYSISKLETVLYTYMKQRKKWRRRRRNLIAGIIQSLKNRNGKLHQINFTLTFCLTLLENQLFTKKRNRRFRRLPRSNTFWWESVWNSYSDYCFKQTFHLSHSTFTFVLFHIQHKLVKEYVAEETISPKKCLEEITCIPWQRWLDLQNPHFAKPSWRFAMQLLKTFGQIQ